MKWLPEVWSKTNPFCSRKRTTWRGLTAGSLAIFYFVGTESARILQIQGSNQRVFVGWNRIVVLAEAGDVAGDGVSRHCSRLVHRASVGNAARQCRNQRGVAALRLGPKHDVVTVTRFSHKTAIILAGAESRSKKSAATIIDSLVGSASLLHLVLATRY
jgi:hypothetical protein